MEQLPAWFVRVHCGGAAGEVLRMVKTGRSEHEVTEIGYSEEYYAVIGGWAS